MLRCTTNNRAECVSCCDSSLHSSRSVKPSAPHPICVHCSCAGTTWKLGSLPPRPTASLSPAPTAQTTRHAVDCGGDWQSVTAAATAAAAGVVPERVCTATPGPTAGPTSQPLMHLPMPATACRRGGSTSGCAPPRAPRGRARRSSCTCSTARCRVSWSQRAQRYAGQLPNRTQL